MHFDPLLSGPLAFVTMLATSKVALDVAQSNPFLVEDALLILVTGTALALYLLFAPFLV